MFKKNELDRVEVSIFLYIEIVVWPYVRKPLDDFGCSSTGELSWSNFKPY